MPAHEGDVILSAAADVAEAEYRNNPGVTPTRTPPPPIDAKTR
jgi:hypothetical protein